MIHAKFVNSEKCSKIKNVAPDPGNCTRETFVAARQGSDFFVIRSSVGQTTQADGQEPAGNYSPSAIRSA
jgi:hypothetical protein